MNSKVTVVNGDGKKLSCILSSEEDFKKQIESVLSVTPGYGMSVDISTDVIRLVDYFHGDTRATFTIVSIEDTDEPTRLYWQTEQS
ncbi:MAG: hypothetical protein J6L00_04280 [Clostridia bacterium]|nr:hypothetical protein [Clostridia bacterium]